MTAVVNLVGRRFGRLVVLSMGPRGGHKGRQIAWLCQCDCGSKKVVVGAYLKQKVGVTSCGCRQKEIRQLMQSVAERYNKTHHAYPVASHAYLPSYPCNLSGCLPQRPVPY